MYIAILKQTELVDGNGKIHVQFMIDTLGHVRCPRVHKSTNLDLNMEAIKIINEFIFKPAIRWNGEKVESVLIVPVKFGSN